MKATRGVECTVVLLPSDCIMMSRDQHCKPQSSYRLSSCNNAADGWKLRWLMSDGRARSPPGSAGEAHSDAIRDDETEVECFCSYYSDHRGEVAKQGL
jgi:hypothetical protein